MIIKRADFVTSVSNATRLPAVSAPEIAIAGKSNVGKSSFINFLTGNGKLAKTSKDPGRTRLINFFSINGGEFTLVDLPGYGYAKVSKNEKERWGELIEGYLRARESLKNVFVLIDIRREPSKDDVIMINYLHHYAIPMTIIATKADKLSRAQAQASRRLMATMLAIGIDNILLTSSVSKEGKDAVLMRLEEILSNQEQSEFQPE